MHLILFDDETRDQLLPLTYTRPVCDLRLGVMTIREKWQRWFPGARISFITQDYLAEKYPIDFGAENLVINGSALPSPQLCTLLKQMDFNEAFLLDNELIAAKLDYRQFERLVEDQDIADLKGMDLQDTDFIKINKLWDLFVRNGEAIVQDVEQLTRGRHSQPISSSNHVIGNGAVFLEEGVRAECVVFNASEGPIYVGRNATLMEGSMLRGPLAIGEAAQVKMGARIYSNTTIGPNCKVGGEVNNSILYAHSNKAHDGYLGNSVLGEWCNLGADTNTSNLKNNYAPVKLWNYPEEAFRPTGQQFCGLVMGDHSKCGINTMFNTGTVVGVSANIYGSGFPRNFIPSFSWGGPQGMATYRTDRAFDTIERVMQRRQQPFEVIDRLVLLRIFEDTARFRSWENS